MNKSSLTLLACIASFENVAVALPLKTFEPLLVTRLIDSPPDCTETSPPPVVTWICSNESKLKYADDEFDDRSVTDPPSRFHCTLALEPYTVGVNCCPDRDPPTLALLSCTPGAMLMTCHGSRAVGMFSSTSFVNVAPVVVFLVSTTGDAGADRHFFASSRRLRASDRSAR